MKQDIVKTLSKKVEKDIDFYLKEFESPIRKDSWTSHSYDLLHLGHLRLVQNRIDDAKKEFKKGIDIMLKDGKIRNDMVHGLKNDPDIPFYAYLAGKRDMAEPFIEQYLQYQIETGEAKKPRDWNPLSELNKLVYFTILGDEKRISESMDTIHNYHNFIYFDSEHIPVKKFPRKPPYVPPSSYGYAIYGYELVKAIRDKNNVLFSDNIGYYTTQMLGLLKRTDHPEALAELILIILYDLALGAGLRPKINTPLIPKSIIENGYWNKPS